MENNLHNKLDEQIKESLSKYLASKEASNWTRMESMLDAAPKVNSFRWSNVLNGVIGLAILGGGYLLYTNLIKSKPEEKTELAAPNLKTETPPEKPVISTPVQQAASEDNKIVDNAKQEVLVKKDLSLVKERSLNEKQKDKVITGETKVTEKENNLEGTKQQQIFVMGNQPVFGDMLDSAKGIVGETKEKEETKKAALIHSDKPIGWNKIINTDSAKKNKTETKDSLKQYQKK